MAAPVRWKRQVTGLVLAFTVLVGAVGCVFFLVAMSPVRLDLEPGTMVTYSMTTEVYAMDDDRPLSVRQEEIHLVCIDHGNEVAMVTQGGPGERDELTLLRFSEDGQVRRYDPALRLQDDGKALGFFDFNFLPLPSGLDQDWRVQLRYSLPPPHKRLVTARVRRVANGFNPRFELTLPIIEWVDGPESNGRTDPSDVRARWCQIRDLVCRYQFNGRTGVVDEAELAFIAAVEESAGIKRRRIRIALQGEVESVAPQADQLALRDLAVASVRTQASLDEPRQRDLSASAARLRDAAHAGPQVLREMALELAAAASGERRRTQAVSGDQWVIQIASVTGSRRQQAQALADALNADGFPAWLETDSGLIRILIGPYAQRDDRILTRLRDVLPQERPMWKRH